MPKNKTVMEVASNENFRNAKAKLDSKNREAVNEFIEATPDCKLIDIEIFMNGWEEGILYDTNGQIDKIRVVIEVV